MHLTGNGGPCEASSRWLEGRTVAVWHARYLWWSGPHAILHKAKLIYLVISSPCWAGQTADYCPSSNSLMESTTNGRAHVEGEAVAFQLTVH